MRYFDIGKIVNTQGIDGRVRVVPFTDDPTRFELLKSVTAVRNGQSFELTLENVSYHKKFVIIKFCGIDDMTSAERLKEAVIKIPEDLVLPLSDGEYYIRDIIGLKVISDTGENLGSINDIIYTGANDVYVVSDESKKEILIPAIKQCILSVDIPNGIMIVHVMEGLR